MTWMLLIALLLAFAFGVVVGILVAATVITPARARLAAARRAHTEGMATRERLVLLVILLSLLTSAASSVLYVTGAESDRNRVECQAAYNRADGLARDERDKAARGSTTRELQVWRALRDQLTRPDVQPGDVVETIQARIVALEELRRTRAENPYPKPDACRDGHFTQDDLLPMGGTK